MDNIFGNICQNCQMSFENMELLASHSCVEIKQEMPDLDKTISGDPLYVNESQTDIKVEGGKYKLASIIEMVHEHNLKVQDGKNLHDKNTLKQEETNQLNKNTEEVCEGKNELPANKGFCDICERHFKKRYLRVHMKNIHQIETFKVKNSKTIHEEEILCPKCNANFRTIRRLRIHIEEAHEKKSETIEPPKTKRQKVSVTKNLPLVCSHCEESFSRSITLKRHIMKMHEVVLPPKPHETFTNGKIFDYLLYTRKISPGIRDKAYQKHVKETVLSFKDISIGKLTESSVKSLDKKVRDFVCDLKKKWKKCGGKRDVIYKKFQYRMDYSFVWTPELKEESKENEDKNKHLSDEFLTSILEQINDACDKICNVDVDLDRQKEFSQNLKNVTNCYQKILTNRQANL